MVYSGHPSKIFKVFYKEQFATLCEECFIKTYLDCNAPSKHYNNIKCKKTNKKLTDTIDTVVVMEYKIYDEITKRRRV